MRLSKSDLKLAFRCRASDLLNLFLIQSLQSFLDLCGDFGSAVPVLLAQFVNHKVLGEVRKRQLQCTSEVCS
jgi:hypothetical protein